MTKNILLIIEHQVVAEMKNRLIIDGNAVYEIDEECMRKRNEEEKKNIDSKKRNTADKRKRTR